jgi:hypothetical protein
MRTKANTRGLPMLPALASLVVVDGGTVTEVPHSRTPGPAGAQPIGIVVT